MKRNSNAQIIIQVDTPIIRIIGCGVLRVNSQFTARRGCLYHGILATDITVIITICINAIGGPCGGNNAITNGKSINSCNSIIAPARSGLTNRGDPAGVPGALSAVLRRLRR